MCKNAFIAGIKEENRNDVWRLVKELSKHMSENDRDGLGYAAVTEDGDLFGERWHVNDQAFNPTIYETLNRYQGFLDGYDNFGDYKPEKMSAITLHTRMATSGKEFYNTHPFVIGDTSLVHNGVIQNQNELINEISTNDSECVLQEYLMYDVTNYPENINKVSQKLSGWYACGVFSRLDNNEMIMDIFKEDFSKLFAFKIKEINNVVFTTNPEHIQKACSTLKFTITERYGVKPYIMLRLNPITGMPIGTYEFEEKSTVVEPEEIDEIEAEEDMNKLRGFLKGGDYAEVQAALREDDGWVETVNGTWVRNRSSG